DFSPALKAKIDNPATVLCPIDADPDVFADAVRAAFARRADAIGVSLAQSWAEAARAHLAFYDTLGGGNAADRFSA
ncbi:hypothetical protein SAMN06265338_11930, partial [Rhodoblastus acidophilus]